MIHNVGKISLKIVTKWKIHKHVCNKKCKRLHEEIFATFTKYLKRRRNWYNKDIYSKLICIATQSETKASIIGVENTFEKKYAKFLFINQQVNIIKKNVNFWVFLCHSSTFWKGRKAEDTNDVLPNGLADGGSGSAAPLAPAEQGRGQRQQLGALTQHLT